MSQSDATVVSVRITPKSEPQSASTTERNAVSDAPDLQHIKIPVPASAPRPVFQPPCIVNAVGSAMSAGTLGFFMGAVPSLLRNRTWSARGVWLGDGWMAAQSLLFVSGLYTWVQCILQRVRQVDDGINRGAAGCATGLLMGWSTGPKSALMSCAGMGFVSWVADLAGQPSKPRPARAAIIGGEGRGDGSSSGSSNAVFIPGMPCTSQKPSPPSPPITQTSQGAQVSEAQHLQHAHAGEAGRGGVSAAAAVVGGRRARGGRVHPPLASMHATALAPVMWLGALQSGSRPVLR